MSESHLQSSLTFARNHLVGHRWYHQRFDGSPMFLSMIGEAETRREPRKPVGTEARWRICFFEETRADWFLDQADIDAGATALLERIDVEPDLGASLMAAWSDDEQRFDAYHASFDRSGLNALPDVDLIAEFERFHTLATNRFTSSSVIDHFALGTDELIAGMLRTELGGGKESAFNEAFSVATAPVHQSFINQAEVELLGIAVDVEGGMPLTNPEIHRRLAVHQHAYSWLANNYATAQVLPIAHFEAEIEGWLASGRKLAEQLADLASIPERNRAAKAAFLNRITISPRLRKLLTLSEQFTRWQDERKRATYLSIELGSAILTELAVRRGLSPEQMKFLVPSEIRPRFLGEGGPTADELGERAKRCVVIWTEEDEAVTSGAAVAKIHELVLPATVDEGIEDLRGLVANTGRAIGPARVVLSAEDIGKVEPGDILVAVMTRPDYVPAMRRAAAIVTDEGGITSHAAIVSRELGVPCIIGTKVATKTFADGDMVEVNANHNLVRRVGASSAS